MTAHGAHMMAPQDALGVVMLATIGPERKLFETSLPRAKAHKQRTPLASMHEGSVAHRTSKLVCSMLVGSVEMRLFDTRLPRDRSAHHWGLWPVKEACHLHDKQPPPIITRLSAPEFGESPKLVERDIDIAQLGQLSDEVR